MVKSYLSGRPWPEADFKSLKRYEDFIEDFFDASAADVEAVMGMIDEQQRNKTD